MSVFRNRQGWDGRLRAAALVLAVSGAIVAQAQFPARSTSAPGGPVAPPSPSPTGGYPAFPSETPPLSEEDLILEATRERDPAGQEAPDQAPAGPAWDAGERDMELIGGRPPAGAQQVSPTWPGARPTTGATVPLTPEAYEELLRENMSLRRQMGDFDQRRQMFEQENRRLQAAVTELEQQAQDSAAVIERMKQQAPEPDALRAPDPAIVAELRRENESLRVQVEDLRRKAAATASAPGAGSDLFRALQQENGTLKQRVQALEAEKGSLQSRLEQVQAQFDLQKAEFDVGRARVAELEGQLKGSRAEQGRQLVLMEQLARDVPRLNGELEELRTALAGKEKALEARGRELAALRSAVSRSEARVVQAERMASIVERTRRELGDAVGSEERDMHYNLGVAHAREGRFEEAEQEYLRALKVDPSDAAAHFNLALLYDEALEDSGRAASHYRAYLKYAPKADDADDVRAWLSRLSSP